MKKSTPPPKKNVKQVAAPGKTTPVVETIKIDRPEEGQNAKPGLKASEYNQWTDRTMAFPRGKMAKKPKDDDDESEDSDRK